MKPRLIVIVLAITHVEAHSFAQVVSVQCCAAEHDMVSIGACMSGPSETQTPPTCEPTGTCVLSFGANTDLMDVVCDPDQPDLPNESRAFCTAWRYEGVPVTQQCVVSENVGIDLLSMYDLDYDGDMDLRDLATFQRVYQSMPKQVQGDARLVYAECCFPEVGLRNIGQCLSGPGVPYSPRGCESKATCALGFSAAVEVGDLMYTLCRPGPATLDRSGSFCLSWRAEENVPIAHHCDAAYAHGVTSFVVFDEDGDGDLDLADFAAFQREFALPPSK